MNASQARTFRKLAQTLTKLDVPYKYIVYEDFLEGYECYWMPFTHDEKVFIVYLYSDSSLITINNKQYAGFLHNQILPFLTENHFGG